MATVIGHGNVTYQGYYKHTWSGLANGDTGRPLIFAHWPETTVQVFGTFDGATVIIEGSPDGINWNTLNDHANWPLDIETSMARVVIENTDFIRPRIEGGGAATSLDVYVVGARDGGTIIVEGGVDPGPDPDPDPDPEPAWWDGGWPDEDYVEEITIPGESTITTVMTDSTAFDDAFIDAQPASCRIILEPGTYRQAGENRDFFVVDKTFVHIVGQNAAWVEEQANPEGTRISGITSWENGTIVLENLIFDDISEFYDGLGGPDYAVYTNREQYVLIKNCVFGGRYLHHISFKRAQLNTHVVGARFLSSERHSIEIGQEMNYAEDLTQVQKCVIYGNWFEDNVINCITNQSSALVRVIRNRFHNPGRPFRSLPLNGTPNPEMTLRLLTAPLRVEFIENEFTGAFSQLWFEGRGRTDDTVYFMGNIGIDGADLLFTEMHPDDVAEFLAAGDPVETNAAPTLDPNSDLAPAEPTAAPTLEGFSSGASAEPVTTHQIILPTGFRINERVYIYLTVAGSDALTIPAGWTAIYDTTNQLTGVMLSRLIDGTESYDVNVVSPVARMSSWVAVRVSRAADQSANWLNNGDDPTNAPTPSWTPPFGTNEYLWLTAAHWRQGTRTPTAPTGFTIVGSGDTGFAGFSENHTSVASRVETASGLTPGDWTTNQVDTEGNNHITSLAAILGGGPEPGASVDPDVPPDPDPEPDPDPTYGPTPVVEGSDGYFAEDLTTDHVIPLPAGIQPGDRLFVFISCGASDLWVATPAGWDIVYDTTNQMTGTCMTRIADGSEGASVTFTSAAARAATGASLRISGATGDYYATWGNGDNPTNADSLLLAPAGGEDNYLWLSVVHWRQGTRVTTPPTGFTAHEMRDTGFAGAGENHTAVASMGFQGSELQVGDWISTEISPDTNQFITAVIAVPPPRPA